MTDFAYSPMFPTGTDSTEYELVTTDHVEVVELGGERFLKVDPCLLYTSDAADE